VSHNTITEEGYSRAVFQFVWFFVWSAAMKSLRLCVGFFIFSGFFLVTQPAYAIQCGNIVGKIGKLNTQLSKLNTQLEALAGPDPRKEKFDTKKAALLAKFDGWITTQKEDNPQCFDEVVDDQDSSKLCLVSNRKVTNWGTRYDAVSKREYKGQGWAKKKIATTKKITRTTARITTLTTQAATCGSNIVGEIGNILGGLFG